MRSFFWLSILFAFFAAAPASAQGSGQQHCTDDAYRLCEAQIPDASAVENCLRANMSRLSRDCRQEFTGPIKKTKPRARRR
jgi:hypothetical protein